MAVFQESGDAGESIAEAEGIVFIPEFDKIEGNLFDGGDYDFYELQLDSDVEVNVESSLSRPVILFNSQENIVSPGDDNKLSFSGEAGDTFFLQVGQTTPEDGIFTQAIIPYEVTLDVNTNVPTDQSDTLTGTSNDETISGLKGDDLIYGREGADSLKGNDGNDTIYGGDGDDYLVGGKGSDKLYDEAGDDIFYYSNVNQSLPGNAKDSVGLDVGEDRIDLSFIDADVSDSGNQSFDLIGTSRFSGGTGQVRYDSSNDLIQVELGGDGDTIVDMEIASHKDFSSLSADDFIL